ncbi:MAG: phage portal protein [Alphaproteobacteria bacterium]|nr:MAG: phage portal protein [Alphaproteobacteria bacterium]
MFFKKKSHISLFAAQKAQLYPEKNYTALSKNGYEKNIIVYRCISLIAKSAASIPLILYNKTHEIHDNHPLLDLIREPVLHMNYHSFMEKVISHYLLFGNVYLHFQDGQFRFLKPETVSIVTNQFGEITHYKTEDQKMHCVEDVLHLKTFHPRQEHYGLSPVEAAIQAIEYYNSIVMHNISLIKNGGRPTGALMLENEYMTSIQREELRRNVNAYYTGEINAGRILVLEGKFKWIEMGLSPKDMDFLSAKNGAACEIATSFGVSPILVGLIDKASYNNYKEARMQLWEDTVIPLLTKIISMLNTFLHRCYDSDLHFEFNTDHISALTSQHDEKWSKLNACKFLTDDEKREAVGYSPKDVS